MVKFKEFLVGDLFEIEPTKCYNDLRDEEIKSKIGITPFVTTQTANNGIAGYSELKANNKGNTITASDTTTDDAIFYQEKDFIGRSHVQNIIPKKGVTFNKNISMYVISCMKKSAKGLYDYGNKFNRTNMKNTCLLLPVTPDGTPDYAYMETFIKEMQREYIDSVLESNSIERNRLLSIVGLDQAEYERVKGSIELCDATSYGEFKVGGFFSMESGKNVKKLSMSASGLPVIQGGEANNGVLGYISEEFALANKLKIIEDSLFLTVARVGSAGYVALQDKKSVIGDNAKVLRCKSPYSLSIMLYFQTCLNKFGIFYDYSNVVSEKNYLSRNIKLPTISTGEVDYAYMEDYISKLKLIYIYNRELSVNHKVALLRGIVNNK